MNQQVKVALALGGNLGDRLAVLTEAVKTLEAEFLDDMKCSSIYETPPWGITEQPDFLNLVVTGLAEWKPPAILNFVKTLERELGRVPAQKNGPRLVDIDLIAYGESTWESPEVTVPHPRMHERDFVLVPLVEIWPDWKHPSLGKSARELLASLPRVRAARIFGPPNLEAGKLARQV